MIGQQILHICNCYSPIHLTLKDCYLHGYLDECSCLYSQQAHLYCFSSSFGIFQQWHGSKCSGWFILISIMAFNNAAKSRGDRHLVLFLPIIENTLPSAALLWGIVSKNKTLLVTCGNFGLRCAHIMSVLWYKVLLASSECTAVASQYIFWNLTFFPGLVNQVLLLQPVCEDHLYNCQSNLGKEQEFLSGSQMK